MDVPTAVDLINQITTWPDWAITASDHTKRHEGAVLVTFEYSARNSDSPNAPAYDQWVQPFAHASFIILCDLVNTDMDLYAIVLGLQLNVLEHEAREFFGIKSVLNPVKPFHPHQTNGIASWQIWQSLIRVPMSHTVAADVYFGVA
jgi:hypothetical protein